MNDVDDLLEQREKLKSQLLADSYNIFVDRLLNWIGRASQKLSRSKRQPSFVYSAFLFSLFALLLDILVSLVFNDFRFSFRRDFIPVELLMTGGIFAILVSLRTYFRSFFNTVYERLIDHIQDTRDLRDLEVWLSQTSNSKNSVAFALMSSLVGSAYFVGPILALGILGNSAVGPDVLAAILFFMFGIEFYYFAYILALMVRISDYKLKIYELAPKQSEVIKDIAALGMNFIYQIATIMAILTAALGLLGWTNLPVMAPAILIIWSLIAILFVTNQFGLARIVTRAKWKTLNNLQAQIEQIRANGNLIDKETIDAISKLMDFHDRIQNTPNSALDLRAVFGFINSLLLPLLAFALANFKNLLQLFGK